LLLVAAQFQGIHAVFDVKFGQLILLLEEGFSLLFGEVLLVVGVAAEGHLIVRVLGLLLMENVFLSIRPVGVILSIDRLLVAGLWWVDMLYVLRALSPLLLALIGRSFSSEQRVLVAVGVEDLRLFLQVPGFFVIVYLGSFVLALMHLRVLRPHVLGVSVSHETVSAPCLPSLIVVALGSHARMNVITAIIANMDTLWFLVAFDRVCAELPVLLKVN